VSAIGGTAGVAGEVVTAAKLKTMASTLGIDYVRDTKNENQGYPVLSWQNPDAGQNTGADSTVQPDTSVASVTLSSVTSKTFSSIALSWTKSGTATGYEIYRATGKNGSYSKIQTIQSGDTTATTDSSLTCGKTYYYKIRAYRTVSGKNYYGSYSSVKSAAPALDKTQISQAKNLKGKMSQLTWKRVSGASGYEVYRSLKKTKSYKKIATVKKGSTVTWKNKKLIRGKTYYYKIRAYRTVNGKKVYSSWSSVKSVKVKK
jgi:fibronectin type 3 domain-containing protein